MTRQSRVVRYDGGEEEDLSASTIADDNELPADFRHYGRRESVSGPAAGVGWAGCGQENGGGEVVVVGSDDSKRRLFTHFQTPPNTECGSLM